MDARFKHFSDECVLLCNFVINGLWWSLALATYCARNRHQHDLRQDFLCCTSQLCIRAGCKSKDGKCHLCCSWSLREDLGGSACWAQHSARPVQGEWWGLRGTMQLRRSSLKPSWATESWADGPKQVQASAECVNRTVWSTKRVKNTKATVKAKWYEAIDVTLTPCRVIIETIECLVALKRIAKKIMILQNLKT